MTLQFQTAILQRGLLHKEAFGESLAPIHGNQTPPSVSVYYAVQEAPCGRGCFFGKRMLALAQGLHLVTDDVLCF